MATDSRVALPPREGVREAPFALRSASAGEPNDGLTLDGYGAVFNRMTVIDSYDGRFRERIAPGAMRRSFRETPPIVQFDHGRHSMIGSIPIAELRSITEDVDPVLAPEGGAHVVARIFDNWLMEPVRDAIAGGAINGMSFRFSVVREAWETADGKPIRDEQQLMDCLRQSMYEDMPTEALPIRTLKELKVPEVGPVVWPAYAETSVGVRSKIIDLGKLASGDPEQKKLLARAVFMVDDAERSDAPPDTSSSARAEGDDDPAELALALDATLDSACELLAGIDTSTLPPEVAQAASLLTAAETVVDELLDAMGIPNPDEDDATENEGGRSQDVDAQQVTETVDERPIPTDAQRAATDAGERPSKPRTNDLQLRLRNQRDSLIRIHRKETLR